LDRKRDGYCLANLERRGQGGLILASRRSGFLGHYSIIVGKHEKSKKTNEKAIILAEKVAALVFANQVD